MVLDLTHASDCVPFIYLSIIIIAHFLDHCRGYVLQFNPSNLKRSFVGPLENSVLFIFKELKYKSKQAMANGHSDQINNKTLTSLIAWKGGGNK